VAEDAGVTFALADSPTRLGPRLSRAQIEQTMRETHLDEDLKTSFLWQEWESGKRGREK